MNLNLNLSSTMTYCTLTTLSLRLITFRKQEKPRGWIKNTIKFCNRGIYIGQQSTIIDYSLISHTCNLCLGAWMCYQNTRYISSEMFFAKQTLPTVHYWWHNKTETNPYKRTKKTITFPPYSRATQVTPVSVPFSERAWQHRSIWGKSRIHKILGHAENIIKYSCVSLIRHHVRKHPMHNCANSSVKKWQREPRWIEISCQINTFSRWLTSRAGICATYYVRGVRCRRR